VLLNKKQKSCVKYGEKGKTESVDFGDTFSLCIIQFAALDSIKGLT